MELRKEPRTKNNVGIARKKQFRKTNGCSSIGRVAVSKTVGWEFESLHPCKARIDGKA
jgi:hypothetical protein